jgi:hypothetical protein
MLHDMTRIFQRFPQLLSRELDFLSYSLLPNLLPSKNKKNGDYLTATISQCQRHKRI